MSCGRCGRELRGNTSRCVYCGWTRDPSLQAVADAGKVQRETFRCGATLWPFVASALILGGLAGLVAWMGFGDDRPAPDGRWRYGLVVGTLVFLGPVLSAVQLLRRRLIWVHIDPEKGIETPRGAPIPWEEIASINRYPGIFNYKDTFERMAGRLPQGTLARKFGCLLLPAMLICFVFLPVLSVLSPWHARVTIALKSGERVVLRDLEDSDRFARMVRYKIRGTGPPPEEGS